MTSTAERDPLIGIVLAGQFRIQQRIGAGAMGAVYLADQLGVGRQVVIKLMHPNLGATGDLEERFQREARLVAQLNHPNVVQLYTFGRCENGQLYLAMEYVPGRTLRQLLHEEGPQAEARALDLMDQLCAALHEAHALGIVHRDLKPDNVMLTRRRDGSDLIKVLDFGIAKPTQNTDKLRTATGAVFGTPQYMAPEQVRARAVDQRTDIYALGLIAYELLTGAPAFEADTAVDLMLQQVSARVVPPSERRMGLRIGQQTERAITRCLEKDPAGRFSTTPELQAEIRAARQRLGSASEPPGNPNLEPRAAEFQAGATVSEAGSFGQHVFTPPPQAPRTGSGLGRPPTIVAMIGTLLLGMVVVGSGAWLVFARIRASHGPVARATASLQAMPSEPEPTPAAPEPRPPRDSTPAGPARGKPAPKSATGSELAGVQRKQQAYVNHCYNRVTERAYSSRARYRSWVNAEHGPSLHSSHIYGLYETTDPAPCKQAIESIEALGPDLPRLDRAVHRYVQAADVLYTLTQQANRYYEQRDYEEDQMAGGRQLHRPLLAAFAGFTSASEEFGSALDEQTEQLVAAHEQSSADARLSADVAARQISKMANVDWRAIERVDAESFRQLLKRYDQLLNEVGKPANEALNFLAAAKEFARRVQRPNWAGGERMNLKGSGSAWMVVGSPSDVLTKYNAMSPLFPDIARRDETPLALSIDPF